MSFGLYKKIRRILHLFRHKALYIDPGLTYYPDCPHKPEWRVIRDQIGHIFRYGFINKDYYILGIDVEGENWKDYIPAIYSLLVLAEQNKAWANNNRGFNYVLGLDDKWSFAQYMENGGFPIPKTLGLLYDGKLMLNHSGGTLSDLGRLADFSGKYLIKPVLGLSGKGLIPVEISGGKLFSHGKELSVAELRAAVKDGKFLVQSYVENQHPGMKALFDKSLNTVRVTMVRTEGGVDILGIMCLMGASDSEYSNWHYGGICTTVDENGKLGKYGYSMSKKRITEHPDTGLVFAGYELPCFRETLDLCRRAMDAYYGMKTVGWDVAVTEEGPILLEGNPGWGLIAHQMVEHRGWADKYRKYFGIKY